MSLSTEWRRRVDGWRRVLATLFYEPLGDVALEGFVTQEQLSAEQAAAGRFVPMPTGTPWGAKFDYGWFRATVTTPEDAAGGRLVVRLQPGGESTVFVDGVVVGGADHFHTETTLARAATPGTRYALLLESYGGHGDTPCGGGPVPYGTATVPEPPPTQRTVGESTFGLWREDLYALWFDVETLVLLRDKLEPNALRVAEIDQALRDFTVLCDLELPYPDMQPGVQAARERLQPLLACVNGSTAPTLYAFGHSHIDVAWLWPLAETERKCARTFGNQLTLMAEYPEYKFLQSQPHLFRMAKTLYPELYARVKAAAVNGQFVPEGGMWVEADTNVTGGESLIRQFLHGKRFYREEFGIESELMWLPDVFGYSGNLPQILRGCGIKYFSTAKIMWNYNGGDPFPYNTFTWEGIDGSEVLAHMCNDYNSQTKPTDLIERWEQRVQKDGIDARLFPFGWGDGGGGATREHLEFLRREANLEGAPKTRMASPVALFKELEASGKIPDARYVGELYYQCHRGTYTSQARTKRGNRKSEFALREAELWGAAAHALAGYTYPLDLIDEAWKKVLLNQFHDIIPGSSIRRVYDQAEEAYLEAIDTAEDTAAEAVAALTDDTAGLTVFNSLSWPRIALVALPDDWQGAAMQGAALPVQTVEGETLAEVSVPACGWTTLTPAAPASATNTLKAAPNLLENAFLRLTLDPRGAITSIVDKETGREWAAGPCNDFKLYKDVAGWFDAWDIDSMYKLTPVDLPDEAEFEVVADGPLVATLRITRRLHDSMLTQEISLSRDSRRVDFRTIVDWAESHKLLKVAFPVTVYANEAVHEIQFGHIRRPNHNSRPFDADRFEVAQQKWSALVEEGRGAAVLNDCKYGINVVGNTLNLTLLRATLAPDMVADKGMQEFVYAFLPWDGSLADSPVVREAYALNVPVLSATGAAGERSLFTLDAPDVLIDTVKPAEDGSGDIIVRLYESKRTATACTLRTTLPVARVQATNMLEVPEADLPLADGALPLSFRAFEIKTVRLTV